MSRIQVICIVFVVSSMNIVRCENSDSRIVENVNEFDVNRYHFRFYTDYGISRDETGELVKKDDKEIWVVKGLYSYTGQDLKIHKTQYVADENGYRAETEVADRISSVPMATLASLAGGGLG